MERISHLVETTYAAHAPHIWRALGELERTGWVEWGIANPETVKEHTERLMELGREIATELGFPHEDQKLLLEMLEVHDWPEATQGDQVILEDDEREYKRKKDIKFEGEKNALAELCAPLLDVGARVQELWLRFEKGDDKLAVLARQIDKYQAVEKALEYEKRGGCDGITREFYDYTERFISHPTLLGRMACIRDELTLLTPK